MSATAQSQAPSRQGGPRRAGWGWHTSSSGGLLAKILLLGIVAAIAVWMAIPLIREQSWLMLGVLAATTAVIFAVYLSPRRIPLKYLVPGTIFLIAFQVVPVVWTLSTAFTNFGDGHRGSKQEAIVAIQGASLQRVPDSPLYSLTLATKGPTGNGDLVFLLYDPQSGQTFVGTPDCGEISCVEPLVGAAVGPTGRISSADGYTILSLQQVASRSSEVSTTSVPTANGAIQAQGLTKAFEGIATQQYDPACDCITDIRTGQTWTADGEVGYFVDATGANLSQGWRVFVGLDNFTRVLTDPTIRAYFGQILAWNFAFAILVVATTFGLGLAVALALNHPQIRALRYYRALIVLPYAMPAFAMLLVWRDMFNQDFGLINELLGTDINWLGNPWTARLAVILIQIWLGYPYMFLVTTGAIQSIPSDLTEAAGVDGATPFFAFRSVTFPMLLIATAPLLISAFAFNFNNFNAIGLTTDGGPFPPDSPQAGATDLLITYTYRLAFGSAGAEYGFAAAISAFIFLIVATISIVSFRRTATLEEVN